MSNTHEADPADPTHSSGEETLRGDPLAGSERQRAADHTEFAKKRNPDTVVRVDNEEDTLYSDGLEVEDDTPPLTNTDGTDGTRERCTRISQSASPAHRLLSAQRLQRRGACGWPWAKS